MKRALILICIVLIISVACTGCKSTDYKQAVEYQESGNFAAAIAIYEELDDYEDSAARLEECRNTVKYQDAVDLMDSKDYQKAAKLFEEIGAFNDSEKRLNMCNDMIDAIANFNDQATQVEEKNSSLDKEIAEANSVVLSEEKALDESLRTSLETAISSAKAAKFSVPAVPDELGEIQSLVDEMSRVNYDAVSEDLSVAKVLLEKSIKQYALVNAPSESYVIDCLKKVSGIVDISAATEDNDPNGHLGKAGSYTAAVFFTHQNVDQSDVLGNTVIEKGTEGGGQVEVYTTEEDANRRNDYLAGFDGSFISPGSHTVIGTVVIRTSDKLTASQQKELEASIIDVLTSVD